MSFFRGVFLIQFALLISLGSESWGQFNTRKNIDVTTDDRGGSKPISTATKTQKATTNASAANSGAIKVESINYENEFRKIDQRIANAKQYSDTIAVYDPNTGKLVGGSLLEAEREVGTYQKKLKDIPVEPGDIVSPGLMIISPNDYEKILQAKAEIAAKQRELNQENAKLNQTQLEIQKLTIDKGFVTEQQKIALRALDAFIRTEAVQSDFSNFKDKYYDLNTVLDHISNQYDKSAMGAYLSDKLTALLNDKNLFCAAKNQCDNKSGPIKHETMQQLLFPSAVGNARTPTRSTGAK